MEINVSKNGTEVIITPVGRIDTVTAPELQTVVDHTIGDATALIFDLIQLKYLSSAGLRVLMGAQKTMNQQGEMYLRNVNEDILDIFDMTGLTDVFEIE